MREGDLAEFDEDRLRDMGSSYFISYIVLKKTKTKETKKTSLYVKSISSKT